MGIYGRLPPLKENCYGAHKKQVSYRLYNSSDTANAASPPFARGGLSLVGICGKSPFLTVEETFKDFASLAVFYRGRF